MSDISESLGVCPAPPAAPFRLIFAATVIAKPGEAFSRPDWDSWTVEYILSGTGVLEVAGERHHPERGDLYILPKGKPHRYWADKTNPWSKRFIVVDGPLVTQLMAAYRLESTIYIANSQSQGWFDALLNLKKCGDIDMNSRATILFHELLIHLSSRVAQDEGCYSPVVQKAIVYLNNSVEAPVRIDDIAAAAGRSKSQFSRVFRDEVGVSPYDYLIRLRMDLAKTLLSLTSFTVAEVADRLCYADAYYFSNAFKKSVGVSPREFRHQARQG